MDDFGHGLIEGLTDAAVVTDARLSVIGWNPAMEQLTGVPRAEAVGRPAAAVLAFLCEADGLLTRALAGETVTLEARCAIPGRPGDTWLAVRYVAWRSATGAPAGVIALHTDVTEQRQSRSATRHTEPPARYRRGAPGSRSAPPG